MNYTAGKLQQNTAKRSHHIYLIHRGVLTVIPAQAGIQGIQPIASWIPAFAGMTRVLSKNSPTVDLFKIRVS
jgi:hypothetical protein